MSPGVIAAEMANARWSSVRRAAAEASAIAALATLLVLQLTSHPLPSLRYDAGTYDGYPTYAEHLRDHRTLIPFRRLPGYPAFLALVDAAGPGHMLVDAYWTQAAIAVGLIALLWAAVRRHFGPAVALAYLALFSFPNFLVYYAGVILADLLFVVLWLALLWCASRYLRDHHPLFHAPSLAGLTGLVFVSFLVHPATRLMAMTVVAMFATASWLLSGRLGRVEDVRVYAWSPLLRRKLAVVASLILAVTTAAAWRFDTGSATLARSWIAVRVVMCLPPASDAPDERRIEEVKDRASRRLGYPVAYEAPVLLPEFREFFAVPDPVWKRRLAAAPWQFVQCGLREIRFRHHIIVKQFFPLDSERRLITGAYMPITGSPRSTVYRATGIELNHLNDASKPAIVFWAAALEAARIVAFFVLLAIGGREMFRRQPVLTATAGLAFLGWILFVAVVGLPLEPRYLNGFAPALYLAQAIALVRLAEWSGVANPPAARLPARSHGLRRVSRPALVRREAWAVAGGFALILAFDVGIANRARVLFDETVVARMSPSVAYPGQTTTVAWRRFGGTSARLSFNGRPVEAAGEIAGLAPSAPAVLEGEGGRPRLEFRGYDARQNLSVALLAGVVGCAIQARYARRRGTRARWGASPLGAVPAVLLLGLQIADGAALRHSMIGWGTPSHWVARNLAATGNYGLTRAQLAQFGWYVRDAAAADGFEPLAWPSPAYTWVSARAIGAAPRRWDPGEAVFALNAVLAAVGVIAVHRGLAGLVPPALAAVGAALLVRTGYPIACAAALDPAALLFALNAVTVWLLLRIRPSSRRRALGAAGALGLLAGVGHLTEPYAGALFPAVVFVCRVLRRPRSAHWRLAILFALVAAVPALAWGARNQARLGHFVTTTQLRSEKVAAPAPPRKHDYVDAMTAAEAASAARFVVQDWGGFWRRELGRRQEFLLALTHMNIKGNPRSMPPDVSDQAPIALAAMVIAGVLLVPLFPRHLRARAGPLAAGIAGWWFLHLSTLPGARDLEAASALYVPLVVMTGMAIARLSLTPRRGSRLARTALLVVLALVLRTWSFLIVDHDILSFPS